MMITEEWIRENPEEYENAYSIYRKFGSTYYKLSVIVYDYNKSIRYWIALSSGKKRRDFDIYEDKELKSDGGIKALMWVKEMIFSFPEYFKQNKIKSNKSEYICIKWADSRRRDIYSHLLKRYGFYFMQDGGEKLLIKKITT